MDRTMTISVEKYGQDEYEIVAVGPRRVHRKDGLALKRTKTIVDKLTRDAEARGIEVSVVWV
jgi:hypothetical protein